MSMKDLFFNTALTIKDRKPGPWSIDLAGAVESLHSTAGDAPYVMAELAF